MEAPVLSVVVSTYNRADLLTDCLQSLVNQSLRNDHYEVIVIDNNSTDSTPVVADSLVRNYPNIRLIRETKQGLACARNRGWREAKGDYVAYIDDDARATPDWCEQICEFIKRNAGVAAFGGPYRAGYLTAKPEWYKDEYGSWSLGHNERQMADGEFVNGTNMVFRKAVFEELGGFEEDLGMKGATISYGEETHLHRRIVASGRTVYYCPTVVVYHLVAPYKMNLRWMLYSEYRHGKSSLRTFGASRNIWRASISCMRQLAMVPMRLLFCGERHWQNRLYTGLRAVALHAGIVAATMRQDG